MTRRRFRLPVRPIRAALFGIIAGALAAGAAQAADPQPYDLTIPGTGNGKLDDAIRASSLLTSLRDQAPVAPFALIERARNDAGRIETALNSFGYYAAAVSITIADKPLTDPNLPALLDKIPAGQSTKVRVAITLGPLYHLRKIDVGADIPAAARKAMGIAPGDPAAAAKIIAARSKLLTALQEDGHAFATVGPPDALADDTDHVIDVSYKVEMGPKVRIGQITFKGLKDVHESFVRSTLSIHPGDPYKPSAIEAARQGLIGLGVFSGVSVRAARKRETDGEVPIVFTVHERPMHGAGVSASYATDLGFSLSANWSHRNLLGNAEQLNLSAAATGVGGNATSGIGYTLTAQFLKPRFLDPGQTLEIDAGALKQDLSAYNQIAQTVAGYLRRGLWPRWSGSAGLSLTHEEVTQEGTSRLYQLIGLPLGANYDSTALPNPLADPTKGMRFSATVTPTLAIGASAAPFAVIQLAASTYFDLSGGGRSVLALRALAASIQGATGTDLPPDQRLYAGGSGTVRGFAYQAIGPTFPDGTPMGATSLDAGTVEFRQRLFGDWGAAAFVDAGQAGSGSLPFDGALNVGVGAGARYYTPIGVIRADVAVPLTHVPNGDSFELYIGLGQAF